MHLNLEELNIDGNEINVLGNGVLTRAREIEFKVYLSSFQTFIEINNHEY